MNKTLDSGNKVVTTFWFVVLNLKENAIGTLVDSLKSTLLLEQEKVRSVEGMEVNLFNGEICGVSFEAESQSSDALKRSLWVLA